MLEQIITAKSDLYNVVQSKRQVQNHLLNTVKRYNKLLILPLTILHTSYVMLTLMHSFSLFQKRNNTNCRRFGGLE